ncbi:MAG TPA: GlsB/YeaQ/YmgE family stress response membrane protein [Thermoanaerobaculia bacterium]|nr:GlsB/YeaQ/YmgE family stress response membrane protein [Thermoanaerobaculia bacterium]
MEVLWFIVMGAIAGWLAGRVMRGNGFGLLGDIVVGVIGAFIGGYLFRNVGIEIGAGFVGSLLVALAGGLVLLFIVRLFTRRRSGPRVWS